MRFRKNKRSLLYWILGSIWICSVIGILIFGSDFLKGGNTPAWLLFLSLGLSLVSGIFWSFLVKRK